MFFLRQQRLNVRANAKRAEESPLQHFAKDGDGITAKDLQRNIESALTSALGKAEPQQAEGIIGT